MTTNHKQGQDSSKSAAMEAPITQLTEAISMNILRKSTLQTVTSVEIKTAARSGHSELLTDNRQHTGYYGLLTAIFVTIALSRSRKFSACAIVVSSAR
ncbi:hypothetical protein [Janthinobacterium lividum]|uniref:hypothetical protein n=1 Tax=Janthinobacterium lividum TaxID=29581 RepID=UPI001B83B4D4|nr:hypothetical protein [Janthinobacterium lividum]MBR7634869.1 hypothetical protein [Janthinobacterium lividum]